MPFAGEVELEPLEKGSDVVSIVGPAAVDLDVENVGERAFVARGSVRARLRLTCGRCAKPFESDAEAAVDALFSEDVRESVHEAREAYEAYPVEHHRIDVAPAAREALVLELPFSALCRPDCPGLCASCGADLAEGPCGCAEDTVDPRLHRLKDWGQG